MGSGTKLGRFLRFFPPSFSLTKDVISILTTGPSTKKSTNLIFIMESHLIRMLKRNGNSVWSVFLNLCFIDHRVIFKLRSIIVYIFNYHRNVRCCRGIAFLW